MALRPQSALALTLDASLRDEDEVVGNPLELCKHLRGQQYRNAIVGRCRRHGRHAIVPGERVEHRDRLIEHEQPWPPGQRQRQRQLCLRPPGGTDGAAGELAATGFGDVRVETMQLRRRTLVVVEATRGEGRG